MRKWIFLFSLLSAMQLQAFVQVQCPYGCAQRKRDPDIVKAQGIFKQCLKDIRTQASSPLPSLLQGPSITFYDGGGFNIGLYDENEREFLGYSWNVASASEEEDELWYNPWNQKNWGSVIRSSYQYSDEMRKTEQKFAQDGIALTYNPVNGRYEITVDLSSSDHGSFSFEFYSSISRIFPALSEDVQSIYQWYFDLLDKKISALNEDLEEDRETLRELYEEDGDEIWLIEQDCKCNREYCIECEAKKKIKACQAKKTIEKGELSQRIKLIDGAAQKTDVLYKSMYDFCIQNHQNPWAYYQRGLLNFRGGSFSEALEDVSKLVEAYQNPELAKDLPSEVYFQKGSIESEIGLYNDAILSLNQAIEKDPANKDAYFERAVAYFETGEFELALNDYLVQRNELVFSTLAGEEGFADFSLGLLMGAKDGVSHASTEFIPSILASARGIGNFLWTTLEHPIETPKRLALATVELCNYLKTCDKAELAKILVPEMYELVVNWDDLSSQKRGELAGYSLGKYGTDFLLPIAVLKGASYVKTYHEIKKAEKLCTLETLAKSPQSKEALIQSATQWQEQRASWLAKVEIEIDKQGKHIRSHNNFRETGSEWIHPKPEKKIKELAGKGEKVCGEAGQAGYKERVDCGEIIGYYANENNAEKVPTTMAIIHYSKKGAHIVPAKPKK